MKAQTSPTTNDIKTSGNGMQFRRVAQRAQSLIDMLPSNTADQMLGKLGLQRKRSPAWTLAMLGSSLVLGAPKLFDMVPDRSIDRALGLLGLQRRTSPLVPIAIAAGATLVGVGIGMLIAPVAGKEARRVLGKQLGALGELFGAGEGDSEGEVTEGNGHRPPKARGKKRPARVAAES